MTKIILETPKELYAFGESLESFNVISSMQSIAMESFLPDEESVLGPVLIKLRDSISKAIGVIQVWEHDQSVTVRRYINSMFDVNKNRIRELSKAIRVLTGSVNKTKKLVKDKGLPEEDRHRQKELFDEMSYRLQRMIDESKELHKNIFITPTHMKLLTEAESVSKSLEGLIDGVFTSYQGTANAKTEPRNKRFPLSDDAFIKEITIHTNTLNDSAVSKSIGELRESLNSIGNRLYGVKLEVLKQELISYPIENLMSVQKALKRISNICSFFIDRLRDIRSDIEEFINDPSGIPMKKYKTKSLELALIVSLFQIYSAYFTSYMTIQLSVPMAVKAINEALAKTNQE